MKKMQKIIGFYFSFLWLHTHLSFGQNVNAQRSRLENQAWSTLIGPSPNLDAFERLLGPNYSYIEETGTILNARENVEAVKVCTFDSFKIGPLTAVRISPNAAVAVYRVNLAAQCAGHTIPHTYMMPDVWRRRSHKWTIEVHTQVASKTSP